MNTHHYACLYFIEVDMYSRLLRYYRNNLHCLRIHITAGFVYLMLFNATFNNISIISWRSVLLMEETGGPGENHRTVASH